MRRNGTFSREMVKNWIFIFFLFKNSRVFRLEGEPKPPNEGRQARVRTHKAAILSFSRVLFVAMINYMPAMRKCNRREIGLKIRGCAKFGYMQEKKYLCSRIQKSIHNGKETRNQIRRA